jgi:hypothetical protein
MRSRRLAARPEAWWRQCDATARQNGRADQQGRIWAADGNGLRATDIGNKAAIGGISRQFYQP